jgi:hypothetical protein
VEREREKEREGGMEGERERERESLPAGMRACAYREVEKKIETG